MSFTTTLKSYRPWVKPKEIWYTIPAIIWLILCIFSVYCGITYTDRINPYSYLPREERFSLADPLLDALTPAFNHSSLPKNISDILVGIGFALIVVRILLGGTRTLIIGRRICYLIGFIYLLRIPFMMMTLLPVPLHDCIPNVDPNTALNAILLMFQQKTSCGDLMFSGHTVVFMISTLLWIDYPIVRRFSLFQALIFISFCILCILSLVASGYHYTIDVVVSVIINLTVWKTYHLMVTTPYFENTFYGRFLLFIDQERHLNNSKDSNYRVTSPDLYV